MAYLWLAAGGALGAVGRYSLAGWVDDRFGAGIWGIFVVNVTGSFLLGLFATVAEERFLIPVELRRFVAVGFLGGYTTFSTLTFETMKMAQLGSFGWAFVNGAGSLAAGLAAAYLGMVVGRLL
ncbi:MAG: fluoride efflux transporter CrcB [Thermoleophilia bacterium]